MSPNKFDTKIYSISNLMTLILYHECLYFLYKFSQILNYLAFRNPRIAFFVWIEVARECVGLAASA